MLLGGLYEYRRSNKIAHQGAMPRKRNNGTTISTIKKICDGFEITIQDFFESDLFKNLEQEIK